MESIFTFLAGIPWQVLLVLIVLVFILLFFILLKRKITIENGKIKIESLGAESKLACGDCITRTAQLVVNATSTLFVEEMNLVKSQMTFAKEQLGNLYITFINKLLLEIDKKLEKETEMSSDIKLTIRNKEIQLIKYILDDNLSIVENIFSMAFLRNHLAEKTEKQFDEYIKQKANTIYLQYTDRVKSLYGILEMYLPYECITKMFEKSYQDIEAMVLLVLNTAKAISIDHKIRVMESSQKLNNQLSQISGQACNISLELKIDRSQFSE